MSDFIFSLVIIYILIYFAYKSWRAYRDGTLSNKDIKKYYEKKFELDHRYRSKLPSHGKDGNPYFTTKQVADKAGIYSKAYHEELKKLRK